LIKGDFKDKLKNFSIMDDFSIKGMSEEDIKYLAHFYTDTEKQFKESINQVFKTIK